MCFLFVSHTPKNLNSLTQQHCRSEVLHSSTTGVINRQMQVASFLSTLDFAESLLVESEEREEKRQCVTFWTEVWSCSSEDTEAVAAEPLFRKLNFIFASVN